MTGIGMRATASGAPDVAIPAPAHPLDLDDVVGVSELAAALGVSRAAVSNWAARHDDFPTPLKELSAGPIYSLAQVTRWRRDRDWAHAGPGSSRHAGPPEAADGEGGAGIADLIADANYSHGWLDHRPRPHPVDVDEPECRDCHSEIRDSYLPAADERRVAFSCTHPVPCRTRVQHDLKIAHSR